jgi:sulfopyruvate decarboxylase subunit beta
MMRRDDAIKAILKHRGDAAIMAVYNTGVDLLRIAPSPLNLYSSGAMGQASSWGLGLALGMPERKIMVLDGDGSLLMNLGSLVSVANAAPRNFYHFVFENGCYEANGSHPIPGQNRIHFAGLAREAGFTHSFDFDDLATFEAAVGRILALDGPVFACLKVVAGDPSPQDYVYVNAPDRLREFKAAIAAGK